MFFLVGKFILSLMDTIVFFVSQVNKAIVTAPGVRMDDSFRGFHFAGDNGQQGLPGAFIFNRGVSKTTHKCVYEYLLATNSVCYHNVYVKINT